MVIEEKLPYLKQIRKTGEIEGGLVFSFHSMSGRVLSGFVSEGFKLMTLPGLSSFRRFIISAISASSLVGKALGRKPSRWPMMFKILSIFAIKISP